MTLRTQFLTLALSGLALGPGSAGAGEPPTTGCDLKWGTVSLVVSQQTPEAIEISASENGQLLTRMTVPAEGALRGCWETDLDADHKQELLLVSGVTRPGEPSLVRAWQWESNHFVSRPLAAFEPEPMLSEAIHEQFRLIGGEFIRSYGAAESDAPASWYRYEYPQSRWVKLQILRPPGTGGPTADELLQASPK